MTENERVEILRTLRAVANQAGSCHNPREILSEILSLTRFLFVPGGKYKVVLIQHPIYFDEYTESTIRSRIKAIKALRDATKKVLGEFMRLRDAKIACEQVFPQVVLEDLTADQAHQVVGILVEHGCEARVE